MVISNLPELTPSIFAESVKAIDDLQDNATKESVSEYIGKSIEYTRRALVMGVELGVIGKDDSTYKVLKYRGIPAQDLVKSALADYEPFVFLCSKIRDGDTGIIAARKTKAMFKFQTEPDNILKFFTSWGQFAGLLSNGGGRVELSFDMASPIETPSNGNAVDRITAKSFVMQSLGKYVASVDSREVDYLTDAVLNYRTDPRHSIDDAGRALEDHLRTLAKAANINVSKCSGITEIVNEMKNKKNDYFHTRQWDMLTALGLMRNIAAHSKDKKTELHWEISSEFALSYCLASTKAIYSVHTYLSENKKQAI